MNTPPTATLERPTLYEQIGGAAAIEAAVEAFYERVLSDSLLQPFFVDVDMPMQKTKQIEFLSQALGGQVQYRGPSMKQAHAHLPIEERHFNRVAEHLVHTLQALQVPQDLIDQIVTLVGPLAADIVNTPTVPEGHMENEKIHYQNGRNSSMDNASNQGAAAVMDAPTTSNNASELQGIMSAIHKAQAVIEFNPDGTVITANENFLTTLGYTLDEIQGKHHRTFCDPTYVASPDYTAFWAKLNRGEFDQGVYCRLTKGGREIWIQASYNPVFNENGQVTKVVKFATNITEEMVQKKKTEAEASRIQNMMENAPINVIYADKDFNITFMNPSSLTTLKTIEQYLPCKVEDLLGQSIDIFHKNPAHQRKLLSDPKNLPHRAQIQVGPETLDLLVSAIYDNQGNYTGPMVTWSVITQQLKTEAEMARIQNMMENAPINVIYADKDFNITYVNPASLKTLKTIEELLPCKVEDLLGQSIDIFHKNPAHQRKLLSDPKNLPHRAQIQVGPETLDLLVSAIYDNQGNYTGPMVTWSVITQQLKTEAEVARIKNMMENAPINVMFADLDLTIQYMNPASTKTLKTLEHLLPIKVEQMIGHSIDVFHKNPAHQRKLLSDPKNLPHQTLIKVGDETLDLLVSPIYDHKQEYIGPMVTWEVVTEQERMKAQAIDYEGKMIAISRAQAMIEFGMDGTIITANDNFCKCLGYSLDEIKGKHHSMFADPVYAASPEYQAFWAKLNRGEFDAGVYRRMAKGGNRIWIQASYNPILDANDKPIKVVKFATDITAEKNQAAEFEGKIESISKAQAVIEFNMDGTVISANDNFCQCLGYSLDEIKGKHHRMFADPAYASSPEYQEFWAKLNRGDYDAGQYKRLGKGGKEVWIQASYNPILDANDKPFKVVKFATDITGQKEQEVKLQQGVSQIAEIGTNLASASEELTATSQQMAGTAGETSSQANVVAAAAEEVSKNVQSVATGAEEMSATIKEVAKNTTESAKVAGQAVNVADSANTTVAKLGESSAEIGSIIKVITSIAQQTNLLALNATIEAARAGEAGKGFAVVANEVKELAKETTKATENIGRMIDTIQTDTKGAVEAIAQISAIIKQVNDFQNTIASAVEEQSATTNEMTRNVAEASKGSSEIAGNITSVAQAAKGTTDGANDTQTAAKELSKMASDLQSVLTTLTK